ncbi:hypothetical protein CL629_00060 [bacterium]|nr:hypothetical protein [bacterium]|tara:strand:- start:702 stop:1751 length:1050 start_codon:yes stop_codon:yes gene_type:complete
MTILLVIISLSILIFVHELGHFLFAKLFKVPVEEFGIGFPPRLLKKKVGETTYSLNLLPFGGFVKIFGENAEDLATKEPDSFSRQPIWKRSTIVLAGIVFNIVIAWVALNLLFFTGVPKHLLITDIIKNSPAETAGIQGGDIIIEAAIGETILSDPIATESFVALTKSNKGKEISLTLQRDKEAIEVQTILKTEIKEEEGALGAQVLEIGTDPEPFPQNVISGTIATIDNLVIIAISFYTLITGIFTQPEILESVSGPVGIIGIATQATNLGIPYLIQLMALISLNLAILNLIPFPALDGGRFVFLIIEKIIRRPVPFKVQAITNTAGFAALILLLILITIKDISSLTG